MEEWRDIKGYEGIYQVSSYGRVRSLDGAFCVRGNHECHNIPRKGRILKPLNSSGNYLQVILSKDRKQKHFHIHRLVAFAFCNGYSPGLVVNHKDENRQNNRADNLEWLTVKENTNYGNAKYKMRHHPNSVHVTAHKDGESKTFFSINELCSTLNIDRRSVMNVIRGRRKQYNGYTFSLVQ